MKFIKYLLLFFFVLYNIIFAYFLIYHNLDLKHIKNDLSTEVHSEFNYMFFKFNFKANTKYVLAFKRVEEISNTKIQDEFVLTSYGPEKLFAAI